MAKPNAYCGSRPPRIHIYLQMVAVVLCLVVFAEALSGKQERKHTSTFPQGWLKTLVSIEIAEPNKPNEPRKEPKSIGSGFLMLTPGKHLALVTAKHVVFDGRKGWQQRPHLAYRLNRKEGPSDLVLETTVTTQQPEGWFKSDKHDVACRLMGRWSDGFDLKMIDYRRFLITPQVEAGSPVLILGFPWGMRSEEYAVPILRYGVVAVTDPNIVVDAMLFEGNSGGPVVHTPATPLGKSFTAPVLQGEWLVGLVSKEITFRILDKTGKVIREDRSGLCNVVPASAILELLESPQFKAVDTRTGNIGSK